MYRTISALAVLATAGAASAQQLDVLLEVDTSVANQITVTATSGLSANTVNTSDFTGILLADLLDGTAGFEAESLVGMSDFTGAQNTPDGSPLLFIAAGGTDTGLNIWDTADEGTVTFVAGEQAFQGSATWTIAETAYNAIAAPGSLGDIFVPADDSGDIPSASVIGQWRVVPAPGAMALMGLAGLAGVRRRRA